MPAEPGEQVDINLDRRVAVILRIEQVGFVLKIGDGLVDTLAEQRLKIKGVGRIHLGERLVALILKLLAQAAAIFGEVECATQIGFIR